MYELKIPTRRIAAQLLTTRGGRSGELFLAPTAHPGEGPEQVLETLNDERAFLPFCDQDAPHRPCVVNKHHVLCVRVTGCESPDPPPGTDGPHTLTLSGGHRINGRILVDSPPSASRLVDKLNRCGRFALVAGTDALYFVQLEHIVAVE